MIPLHAYSPLQVTACPVTTEIQSDMRQLCLDQPYSSLSDLSILPVLVRAPVRQSMPCYLRVISYLCGPATPDSNLPSPLMLPANSDDAIRQLAAENDFAFCSQFGLWSRVNSFPKLDAAALHYHT